MPPELLMCQEEPWRPDGTATQKTVALILDEYSEALEDCRRKLGAIAEIVMEQK